MRYFDTHVHLASPDRAGLDSFLRHTDSEKDCVGLNLILNTEQELAVIDKHYGVLPPHVRIIPFFSAQPYSGFFAKTGWYKVHPTLQEIRDTDIPGLRDLVRAHLSDLRGLIVHYFPWGPEPEYNSSLAILIALAREFPALPLLATHGGGYEAWHLRAHTGTYANIHYDFSVSLSYFAGTDYLVPFGQYLTRKSNRIHFGSDWPSAECAEQLREALRIAQNVGVHEEKLEAVLLENSLRLWPESVSVGAPDA